MDYDLIVVGGGAAGIFAAIQCAERNPRLKILLLEKSGKLLAKVRISGGGRCNVTHACFDPRAMVEYYPRGGKELLGPFHRFLCGDMIAWLTDNGVETKIEEDGRVFPRSDSSATIIDCLLGQCRKHGIRIECGRNVGRVEAIAGGWRVGCKKFVMTAQAILWASGSSNAAWTLLAGLGHSIVPPVPSLFTFNCRDDLIRELPGLSVPAAEVGIADSNFKASGPLLITHWGLSGPAILKLSAWAARELHSLNYQFAINVNWSGRDPEFVERHIQELRQKQGGRNLNRNPLFELPRRLWQRMTVLLGIDRLNYADLAASQIQALQTMLCDCRLAIQGKSTYKDEFVTCGGLRRDEIDFRTMESKLLPGLFFTGEVIDIDALTGGFNFQAAWTGAYVAAEAIVKKLEQRDITASL